MASSEHGNDPSSSTKSGGFLDPKLRSASEKGICSLNEWLGCCVGFTLMAIQRLVHRILKLSRTLNLEQLYELGINSLKSQNIRTGPKIKRKIPSLIRF
jgi:hypothetical protein